MTLTAETTSTGPAPVEDLVTDLAHKRDLAAAKRADELARVTAEAEHTRNRADVAEASRRAELDRGEREASASATAGLSRLYREARAAGERSRVAAHLARSGEVRALRLERLRVLNLRILIPVLLGFAIWSTTGVQQGAARLMRVDQGDLTWSALWLLEPVLIGAVAWVITARARLASSGGKLDQRAETIAFCCLGTSIALNLVAAVPPGYPGGRWDFGAVLVLLGAMFAHAVGPVGAAATAHLIGIVDASIADADPWTDEHGQAVPLLTGLRLGDEMGYSVARTLGDREPGDETPATPWPVLADGRPLLPIVAKQTAPVITLASPKVMPADAAEEVDDDTDELIEDLYLRSIREFSGDLFGGRVPGIRTIKSQLRIGQPRAQLVRTYLAKVVRD